MACRFVCTALLLLAAASANAQQGWRNLTAGGPLRPGVYGLIEVDGAPPPLVSPRPLVAAKVLGPARGAPLYLYLPAGQVRRWSRHCQHWDACERPVYFVRMDDAPGRLGRWKQRPPRPAGEDTRLASSANLP